MKLTFLLTLAMLLNSGSIQSQSITFGATGNIGLSKVRTISNSPIFELYTSKSAPSVKAGFFMEKKIKSKTYLGFEALWIQMNGKESYGGGRYTTGNGTVIGRGISSQISHASYIGIPVYCRYEIGNFGIKAGWQGMWFLFGSSHSEFNGVLQNELIMSKGDREDIELNKIDHGPKLGLDFQLNSKLMLRADYYYGLSNTFITSLSDRYALKQNNRQFSLGISYVFWEKE